MSAPGRSQALIPKPFKGEGTPVSATHTVLCDGGLANRLNALLFALILRKKLSHTWRIAWPLNNWCGADLHELLVPPLPVEATPLSHFRALSGGDAPLMLMQENQLDFPAERFRLHHDLQSYAAFGEFLDAPHGVVYFHNQIPSWVPAADVHEALRELRLNTSVAQRAWAFCQRQRIAHDVLGMHIRKTDFGDAVDDQRLFAQVQLSTQRHFVCSDAAEVNQRFATLAHCAVVPKTAFPQKREASAAWQQWTRDSDGRAFPFNIERGAVAVVEGFIDLLILSRTQLLPTSSSSFLAFARLLQSAGVFQQPLSTEAKPMNAQPHAQPHPKPVTHAELFALLNLIRPWQIASDVKVRLGSEGDGGYVMPSMSKKSNTVLSIGIGDEVSFDNQLAELGARVLQFDHTIAGSPSTHPRIEFHRVGWGRDEGPFISLNSMVKMLDWEDARHPILKFDTEGAEWDCLFESTTEDLARFEVLAGEFHAFDELVNRAYFDKAYAVFSKLALTHHVVHMHANNAGGMVMLGGIPFPRLLELTYLRKNAALFSGHSAEPIPGPLDRPNVRQLPEIYLRAF